MRFDVLYGRTGSGKTYKCIEKIKKYIDMGERCIVIVPEQFCYRTEKMLVSSVGAISSETVEVLTFTRLAGRIFAQNSGAVKLPLSAAGKNMLVYRAVWSVKNELETYGLASQKNGFADKVMSIISEFKRYGVLPEQLLELSERADKPALSAKLADLALIYKKYDELFLDDYSDFEDNLYLAADLLEKSDYLKGVHIFIDEFTDFLPQHYKMIEALLNKACDITLCLCADKALGTRGVFSASAKTYFKLKSMCDGEHIPFYSEYMDTNFLHMQNDELLHLEKNYIKIDSEKYDEMPKNIAVFEMLNVYSEIENAAQNILSLVREEGARWREIAVCCGDAEAYFEPLKMIFSRYEIPCFLSEKIDLCAHPLVLTLLSAIDILAEGFSYESVFTYLKTGFANISLNECDLLENYVLATGIKKKAWLQDEVWSYKGGVFDEEQGGNEAIDEIRRRIISPLMCLRENIGSKHTCSHACEAIYNFMCELDIQAKTAALVEEFKSEGKLVEANLYTRIWNSILNVLDQVVLTTGDKKIGMEQLKNLLEAGFMKEQMGIIPQAADAVSVVDVSNARAQECKYLFALGTNTGTFVSNVSGEGMISDAEREAVESMGIQLAPTARSAVFDTDFLIYKALTRPSKKLFVSCALSKMDGTALAQSQICKKVCAVFPELSVVDDFTNKDEKNIFLGSCMSTFGELAMRMGKENEKDDALLLSLKKWYNSKQNYKEKLNILEKELLYSYDAKNLLPRQLDKLYPKGINTSVSRLERYSRCPFSYFIEYTLKAKERKILKIGAPDIGTIMHAVLEKFTNKIACDNIAWSQIDEHYAEAVISSILDEMGEQILGSSSLATKSTQYILKRLKNNLIRCAKLLVMHIASGRFEPVGSEITFGDNGKISAVVVDIASGKKLKIHGIIDRVDKCETDDGVYYRVIDYKSGSKSFSLESIYNKLDLQLVVYLEAAMQERKDAKPAGMLYFNIREPMIKTDFKMSADEADTALKNSMKLDGLILNDIEILRDMDRNFENGSEFLPIKMTSSGEIKINSSIATMSQFKLLSDYVKSSLKQIGDSIAGGKIDIMPYRNAASSTCLYCSYKSVCKFDVSRSKNGYRMCQKAPIANVWDMMREEVR